MKKTYKVTDYILNILSIIAVMVFAISFSAFIPCFFKGFYTPWIKWLDIPTSSGFDYLKIKNAYSNVLDFIWRGAPFNVGMPMSEEGIDHFRDCIPLFWMQLWMMIASLVFLVVFFLLCKKKIVKTISLWKIPLYSYGGMLLILFLLTLGVVALIDFNSLFYVFHKVFFPGKDNWMFDPDVDQVIKILPENYFLVCAVFIISSAVVISIAFIVVGILINKHHKKKDLKEVKHA